jgi:heme/copper-type cytochrome/quinol oxidase subunit 2
LRVEFSRDCFALVNALNFRPMSRQNENPRRYKWPWFVLAAFILGVILTVLWMSFAVRREKQERDMNAPLPNSPAR